MDSGINNLLPQRTRRNTEGITATVSVTQPDLPQARAPALHKLFCNKRQDSRLIYSQPDAATRDNKGVQPSPTIEITEQLNLLAEVAIQIGLGLKPGQELVMTAPLDALPLSRAITERGTPVAGKVYELWTISAGQPRPAGVFTVDASGRATHPVAPTRAPVDVFAVTLEPEGGVPAPTGPIVLASAK